MKKNKKPLLIVVSLVLVCVMSIMGTMAYLTRTTSEVKNTFAAAGLVGTFTLDESKAIEDSSNPGAYTLETSNRVTSNDYTVVPGSTLPKDPKVTLTDLEVNSYLFVEIKDTTPATITWTKADGWIDLGKTGSNGGEIFYRSVQAQTGSQEFVIISGNELTVANDYAAPQAGTEEALSFWGYLAQSAGFADASAAWEATFGAAPAAPVNP